MLSNFMKRRTRPNGPQCTESLNQRKIVFCDWGWHGRSSTNDGWSFSYVDEAEFSPEEDLGCYRRITPDKCLATLSKFAESQLKKNSNIKRSKGWQFVCVIEDGKQHTVPVNRRDRTPRTMLLFERRIPCPCVGSQHPCRETKALKDMKALEIESSNKSIGYGTPPPQYRSRFSTLDTLYEDDKTAVRVKEQISQPGKTVTC